ncbi:MAG: Crp/Fnr family transcriptional regulator [Ignavibacteriae bacterium]|nr:Crp/Fnr family transcriptional regulator [Ignavibacteriota bacterium]
MEEIMEMFTFQELKKGEYFVEEGSRSSEVAFIIEGVIRAFYRTSEGVEYNKTFFIENSFAVSLSAVLQKIESHLCFQTLTDCKLLVADYPKIENLFTKHRSIETIVRIILQNDWVIKKEQRELRFVLNNAEERYLYFQQEYPGLENRIPQYQIASHLGITPIQLSRIRANLSNTKK